MNNKASKRLLAASVASLMLVVAFCGFTYAGDDAEGTGESSTTPYVKNVVVANGSTVEFDILTTQYLGTGYGITHNAEWFCLFSGNWVTLSSSDSAQSNFELFTTYVTFGPTKGSTNTFSVTGKQCGTISVDLKYVLTSVVGAQEIEQEIYYRMDVAIMAALPTVSPVTLNAAVGYQYSWNASSWGGITSVTGLKFYAEGLPEGLSMDINGIISGVPKAEYTGNIEVEIHNGTGSVLSVEVPLKVVKQVASLSVNVTGTGVKEVSPNERYVVKEGTTITVTGVITGYNNGTMYFDGESDGDFTEDIVISGTGERQIEVSFVYYMDWTLTEMVTISHCVTIVSVDAVGDATVGMGILAGTPSS